MKQTDVEKLLKVIKRKTDRKVKYADDVVDFIDFYNLKSGKATVRYHNLLKLYGAWSKAPIDRVELFKRLKNYLPHTKRGFKISINSLALTKKALDLLLPKRNHVVRAKRVHEFVQEYQITTGVYWHLNEFVFQMFKKWCKKRRAVVASSYTFNEIMKTLVDYKVTERQQLYFGFSRSLREKKDMQRGEKKETNETVEK